MIITWSVVLFFMLRFLIKVIKTPQEKENSKKAD